jgi:HAE1 family hydrophobic/amphiphilic exporter-1
LKSAAVVLIGGLLTSTLLTLVFVPAMYTIFDDAQGAVRRLFRRERRAAARRPAAGPTSGGGALPPEAVPVLVPGEGDARR